MSESSNLHGATTRAFGDFSSQGLRAARRRLGSFTIVLAEFRRAIDAEQRYEDLKSTIGAAHARNGFAPCDIPRRIFEEFYSQAEIGRAER